MKKKLKLAVFLLLVALNVDFSVAFAQGTGFTYQGRVRANGTDFTGTGQFKFALVTSTNSSRQATATANLSGTFVTSYTVTYGGSGYISPPSVTITGGGGSGATATANISSGVVTSLTPGSAGSGYTSPPTVTIAAPPPNISYTTYWSNDGTSNAGSEPAAAVSVSVTDGVFVVPLGDGTLTNMLAINPSIFTQPNLQLRIWFNDGVNGFWVLDPLQNVTPAPAAFFANSASNLLGTLAVGQLSGVLSDSQLSANIARLNSNQTFTGNIQFQNVSIVSTGSLAGNAANLTNLNSSSLNGLLTVRSQSAHLSVPSASVRGVAVAGKYCYLAAESGGLRVIDISNPLNPFQVGGVNAGGLAFGVAVLSNYCYVANYLDGLRIYSVSNPSSPASVGSIDNGGVAQGVAVSGNFCYLANDNDGLRVYNVTNPAAPINVAQTNNGGSAYGVAVSGNYCYLANYADGLRIYSITNPAAPINVGYAARTNGGLALSVAVSGNYCYLANANDGLRVYDVSNPANPVNVGYVGGMSPYSVAVSGNYCYLAVPNVGLRVYDVSNPAKPTQVASFYDGGFAYAVAAESHYAYLANGGDGLRVYSIGVVTAPAFQGGTLRLTENAGSAKLVNVGGYYRDNGIVAWGRCSSNGATSGDTFGVTSVTKNGTGRYDVVLTAAASTNSTLIPIAVAKLDVQPTTAATVRIVSVNQTGTNTFSVFINTGTFAAVDNDFLFMVTAR